MVDEKISETIIGFQKNEITEHHYIEDWPARQRGRTPKFLKEFLRRSFVITTSGKNIR